jgi:hypothetical protein
MYYIVHSTLALAVACLLFVFGSGLNENEGVFVATPAPCKGIMLHLVGKVWICLAGCPFFPGIAWNH